MAFGDEDLGVFFSDFGESVTFGNVTVKGNFDRPAADIDFGGGPSTIERQKYAITVPANAFSRLLYSGDSVTIAGAAYKVKGRELSLDGSVATYGLEK